MGPGAKAFRRPLFLSERACEGLYLRSNSTAFVLNSATVPYVSLSEPPLPCQRHPHPCLKLSRDSIACPDCRLSWLAASVQVALRCPGNVTVEVSMYSMRTRRWWATGADCPLPFLKIGLQIHSSGSVIVLGESVRLLQYDTLVALDGGVIKTRS